MHSLHVTPSLLYTAAYERKEVEFNRESPQSRVATGAGEQLPTPSFGVSYMLPTKRQRHAPRFNTLLKMMKNLRTIWHKIPFKGLKENSQVQLLWQESVLDPQDPPPQDEMTTPLLRVALFFL